MRHVNEIIVHASATKPEWMDGQSSAAKRDEIHRWHVKGNGWSDIGYHDLIDRNGAVMTGRPIGRSGAHTKGHNAGTIGVCLIGGFGSSANDRFEDHFTPEQDRALREYIKAQQMKYPAINKISGHNEYAAKACPGFQVKDWIKPLPSVADAPVVHRSAKTPAKGFWASLVAAFLSLKGK